MIGTARMLLQTQDRAGEAAAAALCGGFGLVYLFCIGLIVILALAFLVFWILMLVDCIQRDEKDFPGSTGNSKVVWLVILLASWVFSLYWVAAILYYFLVKRKAEAEKTPPTQQA
ncbi:MAG: hypothetical protein WA148_03250 [Actinomycetota bacterium]